MKEVSLKSVNSISNRINKINKPQNEIIKRLQAQMKNDTLAADPRESYSRMHNRHNRS
jgi:hypothetical protein